MKTKHFYIFVGAVVIIFLAVTAFSSENPSDSKNNKDIIKFSHQLHAEVTDCASCHTGVAEATTLDARLLPTKDVCATCHDVEDDETCSTCHYEDVNEPLIQSETSLYFNHAFHVGEQKMECTTCHAGLSEVEYSFEASAVNPPMAQCYTCHNDMSVASNACELCHQNTADLIPEDHKTVSFNKNHKFAAMGDDENCMMCHNDDFCGTCHVSTTGLDAMNKVDDFYTPYSPHKLKSDVKQQQITRVHDLSFRYTHGIEAKGKTAECQTCHQVETFCAECHNSSGGDFAIEGFVPYSHTQPNFTTIGVGTGGGQHAILAKRDIESCASCHDTQGADASCIMCHTDNDGIKGTNPRTHDFNFMKDNEGDWHNDDGSVCYTCHTTASASSGIAGVGFCGYCHN